MGRVFAFAGHAGIGSVISKRLQDAGYEQAQDPASADFVLTYCTSQTELEDVYFDTNGVVQLARPGAILIDFSPSTPGFARELQAVAVVNDAVAVEAPLAVLDMTTPHALARENLLCFAAGDEDAVSSALPLLEVCAAKVIRTGVCGTAQLAKAACTLQEGAQALGAIEADALCRTVSAVQLSRGMVLPGGRPGKGKTTCGEEALLEGLGLISPFAMAMLRAVREGRFEGPYTVQILMADITAALTAADDAELILPQAEALMHLLELLAVIGGASKTPAALSLVYGDEEGCARAGLDWTRAETAFATVEGVDDDDDDFGDYHRHGAEDDRGSYGFGTYSAN